MDEKELDPKKLADMERYMLMHQPWLAEPVVKVVDKG